MALNILIISPDAPPYKGGISRLTGLLKSGLERLGHNVSLLHPRFRIKEIKFSSIPFRQYRGRYDLIHLHGPTPFLSDLTLLTNRGIPIVYTHHAEVSWLSESLSKIYRSFHRFLARRAQAIIVHSHDYAHLFKGGNVLVAQMPCTFKPPSNFNLEDKEEKFTVLYVGQFRPFKGVDILINAARFLRDVEFILVGEGYLKPKLIRMAEGMRNVSFCTAASDEELLSLYRRAHVICLPSTNTTEGYGLVLIEGALYGCVPLASNLPGVRENVSQLRGILFQPKSLHSLIKIISILSLNRNLWAKLAWEAQRAACIYASTYTPEYYVKLHEEVFRRCI